MNNKIKFVLVVVLFALPTILATIYATFYPQPFIADPKIYDAQELSPVHYDKVITPTVLGIQWIWLFFCLSMWDRINGIFGEPV